ncbi:MAG: ABC transporter ATP-binding protein [Alphaproteobacteria bacterium]|nr:ABC transporter ATP-binding protein [Alphaproteobacteria bacterium]
MITSDASPLLDVRGLVIETGPVARPTRLVHDIDLTVRPGEVLAIVGESGSGKTLTTMSLIDLLPSGVRRIAGSAGFEGQDLYALKRVAMDRVRSDRIGIIFQDPMSSLNPSLRIETQLTEAFIAHGKGGRRQALDRATHLLNEVAIPNPKARLSQYPHELSGGMRQRVMIAMALMCEPSLLIADEATTALDVTVQKQVLDLLKEIQSKRSLSIVFVSHNLGAVAEIADTVMVMHRGALVERGPTLEVLTNPREAYTRRLVEAVPRLRTAGQARSQP